MLDRPQQEASDEEREKAEWDLQREAEKEARLKGRPEWEALGPEDSLDRLGEEKC